MRKLLLPAIAMLFAVSAFADPILDGSLSFDARHLACLEAIGDDPEEAYESAATWAGRGGGYRAEHCEAMALFALDHAGEAATRLDGLVAAFPAGDVDLDRLRVNYSTEAAQAWLQAGETAKAYQASTLALGIAPDHPEARITRARVYFALDRVEDAETDLTSVLAYSPDHAEALRFRADARRRLGDLDAALEDAELSLSIEPSVDTALIRGHIREDIKTRNHTAETAP